MSAKKIILIVVAVLLIAGGITGYTYYKQSQIVKVATGKATVGDLVSIVSGTGQIKPKTYVNVGATAFGRITHLYVKEGDHVKAGQLIATVESEQPSSAVQAQQATIDSSRTDVEADIAAEKTAQANVAQAQADLQQKKFDFDRAEALFNQHVLAKQDYDAKKAAYDMSTATLAQRQAAVAQAIAQTASARSHVVQAQATLRGNNYSLDLTQSRAPFDGLVTNVPVREGETVVVGIQNAEGSTLMTLADMSIITAEVKVDETDIVSIAMNQSVDVTVDALPGRVFKGHVTEVGDQALLRTTGLATSQSTTGTEEAKDFKVVVTLDQTPGVSMEDLRPGLSTTARITTAHKPSTLTIPIQALVQRDPWIEQRLQANNGIPPKDDEFLTHKAQLIQGVYVLRDIKNKPRPIFVSVTTGITGATDIEITGGLKPNEEIVTGRYKILRTLKSGIEIKRDNTPEVNPDANSS